MWVGDVLMHDGSIEHAPSEARRSRYRYTRLNNGVMSVVDVMIQRQEPSISYYKYTLGPLVSSSRPSVSTTT